MTTRLIPIREVNQTHLPGIGLTTVYQLVKDGQLHKVNVGRRSFITADSIDAYIERIKETA